MPATIDPTNPASTAVDLDIVGTLPLGLSGHLTGVGRDGDVHSFHLRDGRVSFVAHRVGTHSTVEDLVAFEGSILVYGDDSSVRQLTTETGKQRGVDLAGHGRTVVTCPKYDPASGELHLVARDWDGAHVHVVVPAGALTRRSRSIVDAPARIDGLAIGRDHVVFLADGMAGVAPRDGEGRATWATTDVAAPYPVDTHRVGDIIVLIGLTPSLERWTIRLDERTIDREILEPTARCFAHVSGGAAHETQRIVWTAGHETIGRYEVNRRRNSAVSLAPHEPGDFTIVPDAGRPDTPDAAWLVGFVHDPSGDGAVLRVIDTTDLLSPALATIRIPRHVPRGLRCAWLPSI